jgi:hypothetical protein
MIEKEILLVQLDGPRPPGAAGEFAVKGRFAAFDDIAALHGHGQADFPPRRAGRQPGGRKGRRQADNEENPPEGAEKAPDELFFHLSMELPDDIPIVQRPPSP